MKRIISLFIMIALFSMTIDLTSFDVFAGDEIISSGTCDGVDWRETSNYEIIIGREGETQTFENKSDRDIDSYPWTNSDATKSIRFEGTVIGNGSMSDMFANNRSLTNIDMTGFDTSNVTEMDNMFSVCISLTSLDLSGFDTSNTIDMRKMFYGCSSLANLDISTFDTSKVCDMWAMFMGCSSLSNLDLSSFDSRNVTDMNYMFNGCVSLTSLDVSSFEMGPQVEMDNMFSGCENLTSLDLTSFDISSVVNMHAFLDSCTSLDTLKVGTWKYDRIGSSTTSEFHPKFPVNMKNAASGLVYSAGSTIPEISNVTYVSTDEEPSNPTSEFPIDRVKDVWSFPNLYGGITFDDYKDMLGETDGFLAWLIGGAGEGGLCFGMAQTVLASYLGYPKVEDYELIGNPKGKVQQLSEVDKHAYNYEIKASATNLIRSANVYQYSVDATVNKSERDDLDGLYVAVSDFQNNGGEPVSITQSGGTIGHKKHHEIAVIGLERLPDLVKIKVYDPNYPGADMYIALLGSPGSFTGWAYRRDTEDGTYQNITSEDKNNHIRYRKNTKGFINTYRERVEGTKDKTVRSNNGVLIAVKKNSQGYISYDNELINLIDLFNEIESKKIYPIDVAAGENDNESALYWLIGETKTVTFNDLSETTELSVAGTEAVMTAKPSEGQNVSFDAINDSVQLEGSVGSEFSVRYDYVEGNKNITTEVSGTIEDNVTITSDNGKVSVTGASNVQTTESSKEIPSEDDPCINGHKWGTEYTIDKSPTCVSVGMESIHCSVCGSIKEGSSHVIPKATHTYSNWTITKKATQISTGKKRRTCSICGKTETQTIAKLKPTLPAVKISKPKSAKKSATIKWKKIIRKNLKKVKKVQIQYSTDKNFKKGVKTKYASAKKTSYKIKSLKKGKKYYVRIRAYTKSGKMVYISKWSKKKSFKAK